MMTVLGRPNALDREVSAIAERALTQSPFSLIDPARASAAANLEQFNIPVWIVMIALQIAVLAWFWNSGHSARLRDYLRSIVRSEFAVRFLFGAALAFVDKIAAIVPQALNYRFERLMDLNELLFRTWLLDWLIGTLIAMAAACLIAAIVLWLADRTHQWWIYTIAGVIGFTLLVSYANPAIIAPASSQFSEWQPSPKLASDTAALEQRTGVHVPILQERVSSRTHAGNAYVMGWGGSQRIAISDTLMAGATEPELRFVVARSLAWIAANNGLHLALVQGAFLVLGTALAVLISDRIGFRRDDDPVSRLALFGSVLGCVYLLALPFYNGYARNLDLAADKAALALTGDRASAVRLQIREADQALMVVCPNPVAHWYFDSHPSLGQRVSLLQDRPDACATRRP